MLRNMYKVTWLANPDLSDSKTCALICYTEPMAPFHLGLWQSWGHLLGQWPRLQQKPLHIFCMLKGWTAGCEWN